MEERVKLLKPEGFAYQGFPVTLWDVFGEQGHPVRATVSEMGPLLLSRLLNLNDTQEGVLNLIFKIADDNGWLLLDLKDLRTMAQHVGDNAKEFTTSYGNISGASVGAIQRALLTLENQGAEKFFGEPALNLDDLMQTQDGRGMINILAADKLMQSPKVYATFLLWLLAELFEQLPEVGDRDKPKLVFFFDEAHLLFDDAPTALLEKIEQVVRLIRSKGVGVFFVSQNPLDIPDERARPARQPRAARAARLHPARPEGGARRGRNLPRQSQTQDRKRHHRTGRGRGAGVDAGRKRQPGHRRARPRLPAAEPSRPAQHAPSARPCSTPPPSGASTKKPSTANRPTKS